jgi:cysteine/O-acetylserine efflux protein
MPVHIIGNFLIYCVINAFTPGPGNILALNTVSNYGWKKGRPLFFGIYAGYYVVQILCAVIVYGVVAFFPGLMVILKYIGTAYILWLAFQIAISRPHSNSSARSASFLKGFMLQLVNVKIYLFGITALTGYVVEYSSSFFMYLFFVLIIATIGTIATNTWIGIGYLINDFYLKRYKIINIILSILLLQCAYSMLFH